MAGWAERTSSVKVGDIVGYSKAFLQSTGQYTGDVPFARGKVLALRTIGTETILAEIEWDKPDIPNLVNVRNLSTARQITLGD